MFLVPEISCTAEIQFQPIIRYGLVINRTKSESDQIKLLHTPTTSQITYLQDEGQNTCTYPLSQFLIMRKVITLAAISTATYQLSTISTPTTTPKLLPNFKSRQQHLKEVEQHNQYDILVIGGGCNGVGVLLDASTRGLRTLLIQKEDFGSGASSKSTKLIHGGVRYLQQVFEVSLASLSSRLQKLQLVKEGIVERGRMIDSAPYLTNKVPFVIPCTNIFQAAFYYTGSLLYYWIYRWYSQPEGTRFKAPYFLNRQQLTDIFPHLNPKYTTGVVYEDGSFNDARLLLMAVLTATVGNGQKMPDSFVPANAVNRAELVAFLKNESGKIVGATFKDNLSGKVYEVKAKYVVNCTGVWSDKIRHMDDPSVKRRLCLVGGSHVVYDARVASGSFGIAAPSSDGRIILSQPWMGRVLAGTTEKSLSEPTNHPVCSDEQRRFINKAMMEFMSQLDVATFCRYQKTRWCGIRPLVAEDADQLDTKTIARNHVIEELNSGLISLMGGKWTVYRKMGEDLVNYIAQKEHALGRTVPPSATSGLPLLGSAPPTLKQHLLTQKGDIGVQLYHSLGWMAREALKGNLNRVYGSTTFSQLEWIVRNELVSSIEDVLMRRTRLCFLISKEEFLPLVEVVGRLLQKQLGWSQAKTMAEIEETTEKLLSYEFE